MLSSRSFRLLFVLFIFLMGLGGGLVRFPYFDVTDVEVCGTQHVSPEEITALTGIEPGINIFSLRGEKVAKAVSGHPWIKSVDLIRRLPDKVVLEVTERHPFLLVPYRTSFLEVAEDGTVLAVRSTLSGQTLPLVTGFSVQSEVRLGQRLPDEEVAQVSRCLQELPGDFLSQVAEIHLDENKEITLYTLGGVQILLGEPVKLKQKLALLSGTWSELKEDGETAVTIDLRTAKEAIVRLKQ